MKKYYITEQFIFVVENKPGFISHSREKLTISFTGDMYVNILYANPNNLLGDLCGNKLKDQVSISLPEDTSCVIF